MSPQDQVDIRNLIGRMAWLTDKWQTPGEYLSHCTQDFSWRIDDGPAYLGHEGMGRRLQEMLAAGVCGPGLPTRHHVTSMEILPGIEDGHAIVRSFVLMTGLGTDGPATLGYGDYVDEVRREGGLWLMASRSISSFWKQP